MDRIKALIGRFAIPKTFYLNKGVLYFRFAGEWRHELKDGGFQLLADPMVKISIKDGLSVLHKYGESGEEAEYELLQILDLAFA